MFDNFLTSLKSQTSRWSASFNDLRFRQSNAQGSNQSLGMHKSSRNSRILASNRDLSNGMSKSQSSYSMNSKQQLKWPVLVNNERQWVSSSSLDVIGRSNLDDFDHESETVFRNPTHNLKDEDSDEECLIDKFDRVLRVTTLDEKVCRSL